MKQIIRINILSHSHIRKHAHKGEHTNNSKAGFLHECIAFIINYNFTHIRNIFDAAIFFLHTFRSICLNTIYYIELDIYFLKW